MKNITIPIIPEFDDKSDLVSISSYMDGLKVQAMDNQPWKQFQTTAQASFSIAHNRNNLLVKYYVNEYELNAAVREINEQISEDNCVELFMAFNGTDNYYNLEFNCFGSAKVGYGNQRNGRTLLPEDVIKNISVHVAINYEINQDDSILAWEILLMIPKEVFLFTPIDTFEGLKSRANFYKCGDGLAEPHFLTWNMVDSASPNFHLPEFFGELHFLTDHVYANK